MDEDLILGKLESLARCLERIEEKTPETAEMLKDDFDRQDIISVNLERAVQSCVDVGMHIISQRNLLLPDSMAGAFQALAKLAVIDKHTAAVMGKTVGFRNTAVHAYRTINWDIVFSICTRHLDDFRSFARQIMVTMGATKATNQANQTLELLPFACVQTRPRELFYDNESIL